MDIPRVDNLLKEAKIAAEGSDYPNGEYKILKKVIKGFNAKTGRDEV